MCTINGTYLDYRWVDMTGDGLPDLVTTIEADNFIYDPNADQPFGEWPACGPEQVTPACPVLDYSCVDASDLACGGTPHCYFADNVAKVCVDPAPMQACAMVGMVCNGRENDPISCESGHIDPFGCQRARVPQERCGRYPWEVYANLGNGEIASTPHIVYSPIPLESEVGDSPSGGGAFTSGYHALTDLDGDGLVDAVILPQYMTNVPLPENDHRYTWMVWKGDGTGDFHGDASGRPYFWHAPIDSKPSMSTEDYFEPSSHRQTQVSTGGLADLNADGLPDYFLRQRPGDPTSPLDVYWNDGHGFWGSPTQLLSGPSAMSATYVVPNPQNPDALYGNTILDGTATKSVFPIDYDGDGRTDLRLMDQNPANGDWSNSRILFDDGAALLSGYATSGMEDNALGQQSEALFGSPYMWRTTSQVIDIDGDGYPDKIYSQGGNLRVLRSSFANKPPRLLTTVANGQGLHVDIAYAALSDSGVVTPDSSQGFASPHSAWVVKSITTSDDFESSGSTTTYRYIDPVWSPDDLNHWGLRGFKVVKAIGPRGGLTEERYDYDVDWSGRLAATLTYLPASGNTWSLLTISETSWGIYRLFADAIETYQPTVIRTFTCAAGQTEIACRAAPAGLSRAETLWAPLATSVPGGSAEPLLWASTRQYQQDGETFDEGDRYTDTTYFVDADASTYRVRPTTTTSTSRAGGVDTTYARSETVWDGTYRVALRDRVYFDAATIAETVRTYDMNTGVVLSLTKPDQVANHGTSTAYAYDPLKLFVVSTTQRPSATALAQTVYTVYDYGTGALRRTLGPNTHSCYPSLCGTNQGIEEQRTDIDALGRPVATYVTHDASPGYQLVKVTQTSYVDAPSGTTPTSVTSRQLVDDTRWTQERTDLDGHGRPIRSTTTFGALTSQTSYDYDVDGKLIAITLPDPSATGSTVAYVTYTYAFDEAGRPTSMRRPDGTGAAASGLDFTYDGLTTLRTEVAGAAGGPAAVTQLVHDAFGRLVGVSERIDASTWATTVYKYDPHDIIREIDVRGRGN